MFFHRSVQFILRLFLAAILLAGFLLSPEGIQRAFAADPARKPTDVVNNSDTTIASAINDGTVNVGEYIGFSTGINSGFGNVIGSASRLYVDSGSNGAMHFGLAAGAPISGSDAMVIYIDTNGPATGFTSTSGFTDIGINDNCRRAISGFDGTNRSTLNFAPGFAADYAICVDVSYAGLWQLSNGGSHTHITPLNRTSVTLNHYEMNLTLSNLGMPTGGTFRYVATYLNASNAYRSDEFHGVSAFGPGNPGQTTVTLNGGDFNTFTSIDVTLVVDRSDDTNALAARVCNDNLPNDCSLRGAISRANNDASGVYTITFDPSLNGASLMLSIPGNDDNNTGGDLDILSNLTIQGNGARYTTINANRLDRVFHIVGVHTVVFNDITITNESLNPGLVNLGGGIHNQGGALTLNRCAVVRNISTGHAGGIENLRGTLVINNSTISENEAWAGDGGGIENHGGTLIINDSTISGNWASAGGGGISNSNEIDTATTTINHCTITDNEVIDGYGGGVNNDSGTVDLNYSIVAGNMAFSESDDDHVGTEVNTMDPYIVTANNHNIFGHSGWSYFNAFGYDFTPGATDFVATSTGGSPRVLSSILAITLADNGGPTNTHALASGSPALNRVACTGLDQRGAARNYNGACDSGSVERREIIPIGGDCNGSPLSGVQNFPFAGNTRPITIDIIDGNGLTCIAIEEMGPGANHLLATDGGAGYGTLRTGDWWHITGNVTTGMNFNITLPYASANDSSRVCRWPGNLGGAGWDCGTDSNNSSTAASVTRTGLGSFSDWTIGSQVSPTAVKLNRLAMREQAVFAYLPGFVALAAASMGLLFWKRRKA